jgi:hypothetical protein
LAALPPPTHPPTLALQALDTHIRLQQKLDERRQHGASHCRSVLEEAARELPPGLRAPADPLPPRWVGSLLPVAVIGPASTPGGQLLILARLADAARGGEMLLVRAAPRPAQPEQLLEALRREVAGAAAAAHLPVTAAVQFLGAGRLEMGAGRKLTISAAGAGYGGAGQGSGTPAAFCSTAAALLQHVLPCDHVVVAV